MPSRLPRLIAPLAIMVIASGACGGGRDGRAQSTAADPSATVTTQAPEPSIAAAHTVPLATSAVTTSTTPPPTAPPTSAASSAQQHAAPSSPEVVETVIGRSTIRFTYPPGLSPDERAALDTYHRFLNALWAAGDPPTPNNLELAATVAPPYLVKLRRNLEQDRLLGRYSYGDFDSHPRLAQSDEGHTRFIDCSLDDSAVYTRDGAVLSPAGTGYTEVIVVVDEHRQVRTWFQSHQACVQ